MDRMVLLEYVAPADDVHMKYFRRRQPPTAADNRRLANEVELSSTWQASRRYNYDSAINVYIYCSMAVNMREKIHVCDRQCK